MYFGYLLGPPPPEKNKLQVTFSRTLASSLIFDPTVA
jgi:hypothetical protein